MEQMEEDKERWNPVNSLLVGSHCSVKENARSSALREAGGDNVEAGGPRMKYSPRTTGACVHSGNKE